MYDDVMDLILYICFHNLVMWETVSLYNSVWLFEGIALKDTNEGIGLHYEVMD